MLNNFQSQFGKNYMFHKPGGSESPKPIEGPSKTSDKLVDVNKLDYTKPADRAILKDQALKTMKKLEGRTDKASKESYKDLNEKYQLLKLMEGTDQEAIIRDSAKSLKNKLIQILPPPATVVFATDTITPDVDGGAAKRKEVLAEARSFGMIGLLKPSADAAPTEKKITASLVEAPKPKPDTKKVPPADVPNSVRIVARNFASSNPGFSGDRYVQGSDGSLWRAKIKPQEGDRNGTTAWEKVNKAV